MIENKESSTAFLSKTLSNGIEVTYYDLSKKMAADRWLVKIKCDLLLIIDDALFDKISDKELRSGMVEKYRDGMVYSVTKERTFIDETEKENVFDQLLRQLDENAIFYVQSKKFPQKLFASKLEEFVKEFQVKKQMGMLHELEEDDDGPADFSACFED